MSIPAEEQRLAEVASRSLYGAGPDSDSIRHCFKILKRYIQAGPILELGPAEGHMTDLLVGLEQPLTCVDGSRAFCDIVARRHPQIEVVHSLFEDFRPRGQYNSIILGHVLEHVENPVQILDTVRPWLAPGGRIMAAVPNSRSVHRQAGVIMGLLPFEEALSELDVHHGHRRVYNPETLRRDFVESGLEIEVFGGYWLKPLSNAQIEATQTKEAIAAFMKLGERYPDIAAEIYVIARNPTAH